MVTYLAMISGRLASPIALEELGEFSDVLIHRIGEKIHGPANAGNYETDFLQVGHASLDAILDLLDKIVIDNTCVIDEIIIHIVNIYTSQCNMEIDRKKLKRIAGLNATLTISCDEE